MNDTELIQHALKSDDPDLLKLAHRLASHPLFQFRPRRDQPDLNDHQTSFYQDRFPGITVGCGGNGSGKSYCGAAKVARFLDETPPPERNTPFWVLSQNMELATATCWSQNLSRFIPAATIHDVVWYSATKGLPRTVVLKPHKNGNNYLLEFKSYDQGRQALQGTNIIGFWLDEQCPFEIITEVLARTRKWAFPGSKLYTLTPVEPDLKLEEIATTPDEWPDWKFYRFNTRCNTDINPDFVRQIEQNEIAELAETRLTGAFARFEGQVYKNFDPKVHVIEPVEIQRPWLHVRGLDLGWQHNTFCVWAARDLEGRYFVYREYFASKTSVEDHVQEINSGWDEALVKGNTYADPAAAQTLHEFSLRGLQTVQANKDVMGGIATVQSLLRPGPDGRPKLFIFKNCPKLISQMRTYVFDAKTGKPKKENASYLMDGVDALRYLCHSHKMDSTGTFVPPVIPKRPNRSPF